MTVKYTILIGSHHKISVKAVKADIVGLYDERDGTLTRPCDVEIAELIPYRYRRAFNRSSGRFWLNSESKIYLNGRTEPELPYLDLYYTNGKTMCRLYAIGQ